VTLQVDVVGPAVAQWVDRIRPHLAQAVEGIVEAGRQLNEAKAALPHGQFGPLLDHLDLSRQMANRFMRVASNPVLANRSPVGGLPAAVSVLDLLTQLPEDALEAAIERGDITPSTTRQQAASLVRRTADAALAAARRAPTGEVVEERPEAEPSEGPDSVGLNTLKEGELCGCCGATTIEGHRQAVYLRNTCDRCFETRTAQVMQYGENLLCQRCVGAVAATWSHNTDELVQPEMCCGWPVHPALAVIPPMTSDEKQGLLDSIREHGCIMPVTIYEEQLLDGRERLLACAALGVEPSFQTWSGRDPVGFVYSANVLRQSFTPDQQAAILVEAETLGVRMAAR
jgi:hypothetical protein